MIDSFTGEYRWLSNFWSSKVTLDTLEFTSVEAAYQAAKTLDYDIRRDFVFMTASQAKAAGKTLKLRSDWEEVKLGIMENLLRQKFQDPELRDKLTATGDEELVETNWWGDTFWGVCKGKGENHLGKLLMKIRTELCQKQ